MKRSQAGSGSSATPARAGHVCCAGCSTNSINGIARNPQCLTTGRRCKTGGNFKGNKMKKTLALLGLVVLCGCSTDKDYLAYLQAQQEANKQAAAEQKPLVRLTAQPGQQITGLAGLEVYTPTAAPVIQQAAPSQWASVANTALGVVGTVAGITAAGHAAVGIANSVGTAATTGYAHVQAPGASYSYGANSGANSGNTGQIAGTSQATATPTTITQPAPVIVQPATPVTVTQPAPVICNNGVCQ